MAATTKMSSEDIEQLLEAMAFKTKIGQLSQVDINLMINEDKTALRQDLVDHYIGELAIGSVLNVPSSDFPWNTQDYRKAMAMIQRTAKKHDQPPVIWGLDSVHGANYVHGRLVTPQPINLAATFNREHSRMAGVLASQDTRRAGLNWLFSPLLGISWEPKWSRVYETFGEDPFVVGELALHMIRGIQQTDDAVVDNNNNTTTAIIPSKAAACAKHFLGYSIPHNGHDRTPSWVPTRHLYQYFLPPWQKVVSEVETVMESYTETDGVPNVANRAALNGILRHRLGFDGVLVTDYNEIYNQNEWHGTAESKAAAVLQSMQEGTVDMSMIPWDADEYLDALKQYHEQNDISDERIDVSARRVIELKHRLAMFDEEVTEDNVDFTDPTDDDIELVMNMTRESIVLAKNADDILPLNPAESYKVLVTGPTSNSLSYQSGGWTWQWQGSFPEDEDKWFSYGTTVLGAMRNNDALQWDVHYACGVDVMGGECQDTTKDANEQTQPSKKSGNKALNTVKGWVGWGDDDPVSYVAIEQAIHDAKDKDYAIICVGEESYTEKPGDIRSSRLPQGQYALVEAIKANTDAKIILVYFGGRPRLLSDMVEHADAVLVGFLPGPMAGDAIYEILTGVTNPSGKLPITYPKFEDSAGSPYMHAVSDRCTEDTGETLPHYDYVQCEVQWPFGHGLSFSKFDYSDLKVASNGIHHGYHKSDGDLPVSVTVTNSGSMEGYDSVMLFSFDEFRSTTPEYKRLRGFEKVFLHPGESKKITIPIPVSDLHFVGPHDDSHYIYESLQFRIGVGAHTDCRNMEDGQDDALCSDPIALTVDEDYIGACEAACDLWKTSGCMKFAKLDSQSCWDKCTAIGQDNSLQMNNDGWGYNYVHCLENLVWNNDFNADSSQCWKMTTFCRDVLATPGMDELGHGATPDQFIGNHGGMLALILSIVAGLVATVCIIGAMRGGFRKKRGASDDIQFMGLPTSYPVD